MTKSNSVLRNIIVNYASQIYVIVLGLAVVPLYLKYMGVEAFGLLGFFVMLQTWMTLFDFGLGPTLGREASKFKAGKISAGTLNLYVSILEKIFSVVGVFVVFVCWLAGDWVATVWLRLDTTHQADASRCIALVGFIFSLRLMSGVYRNGLLGLESQVAANVILVIIATLRSALVLPILIWVSSDIVTFFTFQLIAAIIETGLLKIALTKTLPDRRIEQFKWALLREPARFGGGVAFLAWVWIATSQVDKLILSHLLSLQEYAGFILVTTVAFGVYSLISPLQQAVLPRLVILSEKNQREQFVMLYRTTSILMVSILAGVVGVIAAYPAQVLHTWTGNHELAQQTAKILTWYAAGTGFMAISGMSYVLQTAKGNLGLHIKGNIFLLLIMIPSIIFSTLHFGVIGAAIAWAFINLFSLLFWGSIVHNRFLPEVTTRWLLVDIAPGVCVATLVVVWAQFISWPFAGRSASLAALLLLTFSITGTLLMIHHATRKPICDYLSDMIRSLCKKND